MVRKTLGVAMLLAAASFAVVGARSTVSSASPAANATCQLNGPVKHVVNLVFDNTHYRRDRPNVPSDLEQMPHLLNFMKSNGTLFTNDHTVLISHTSNGILSMLTGLYPDRNGMTVGNSYGFFGNDGATRFSSSFKYWTDPVDATFDPKPNMVTLGGKNTPAPWVPFTRAGCDVGGVGTANIELENTATNASGDMTKVFGTGSPEWNEAVANPQLAQTDFVGIAIHCGNAANSKCTGNAAAKDDLLPDEPGGYTGFKALYGTKYVDPAITGGKPCVNSTAGSPVTDPLGNCGFPGFDGMFAQNTLGYAGQMLENGVPVIYGYFSDIHDCHVPNTTTDSYVSTAQGPGESCAKQQLAQYDAAFDHFFTDLNAHGINKSNTLFVITVDEGDHFAGGTGTPQPDGTLAYAHTNCSILTACPGNQIGEVNANLPPLMPAGTPSFAVHSDDAPTVYVAGNPARTDAAVRKLERDLGAMTLPDPYVNNGAPAPITVSLADSIGMQILHMVNADPARTPTFTLFGNPDIFFTAGANPTCGGNPCVAPGFAWNHGDVQEEIANTWAGIVGPGIATKGVDAKTWTDHTNLRPTIMALAGLKDDYVTDGRILYEALGSPTALGTTASAMALGVLYEKINAPFQQFALDTLAASTKALQSADEAKYASIETSIASLQKRRDYVAGKIKTALWRATFLKKPLKATLVTKWTAAGNKLLADAATLKTSA
jgi:Type I phosphodiesterase / nucleotide pyrophosphatase